MFTIQSQTPKKMNKNSRPNNHFRNSSLDTSPLKFSGRENEMEEEKDYLRQKSLNSLKIEEDKFIEEEKSNTNAKIAQDTIKFHSKTFKEGKGYICNISRSTIPK